MHEVALPGEDEPPVGHVGQRGERVAPQRRERVGFGEPPGVDRHQKEKEEQSRQEAPGPALVEAEERHRARAAPFSDEQRRDEVAGQHEEDVDAEESAAEPGRPGMESEDADDGHGTDAVETRHMVPGGAHLLARREGVRRRWDDAALLGRKFRCRHGQ